MADELQVRIERFRPEPGDLVVVRLPEGDRQLVADVVEALQRAVPEGCRGVVTVGERRLELLRGAQPVDPDTEEHPDA